MAKKSVLVFFDLLDPNIFNSQNSLDKQGSPKSVSICLMKAITIIWKQV